MQRLDKILSEAGVASRKELKSLIRAGRVTVDGAVVREEAKKFDEAACTIAVDGAAVYVNCSTRFTDGGEFGLGCEMGISTQKLHARGPMGLEELCSYKYVIHGNGQIR
mgnify:CR=1 FL=1